MTALEPSQATSASPGPIRRFLRRITGAEAGPAGPDEAPLPPPPPATLARPTVARMPGPDGAASPTPPPSPPERAIGEDRPATARAPESVTQPERVTVGDDSGAAQLPAPTLARQVEAPAVPAAERLPAAHEPTAPAAVPVDPDPPVLARQPVEAPRARAQDAARSSPPTADLEPPAASEPSAPSAPVVPVPTRWRLARMPSPEPAGRSEGRAPQRPEPAETAGVEIAPRELAASTPPQITQAPGPAAPVAAEPDAPAIARAPAPEPPAASPPDAPAAQQPPPAPPRARLARAPAPAAPRHAARIARRAGHDDPAPPARPPLRLVRAGEEPGPVPARLRPASRTTGTGLMRHVADYGAHITDDGAGAATVMFPPPPGATGGPGGGAIARSFLGDAIGAASHVADAMQPFIPDAAATHTDLHARVPSTAQPSGGPGTDMEEIYEGVVERLRRDILAERERMGDVLGDLLK